MNGSEIQRMLKADPDADFAFRRPHYHRGEWRPTYIRGLAPSGAPGTWTYSEIKRPGGDDWTPANGKPLALVHSRELVPGETARADAERTRRDQAKRDDAQRRAWSIAKRLSEHGISARAEDGVRIIVGTDGFEALAQLLDTLSGGGTRDERTQGEK